VFTNKYVSSCKLCTENFYTFLFEPSTAQVCGEMIKTLTLFLAARTSKKSPKEREHPYMRGSKLGTRLLIDANQTEVEEKSKIF